MNASSESGQRDRRVRRFELWLTVPVATLFAVALMIGSAPARGSDPRAIAWAAVSFAALVALVASLALSFRMADERQRSIRLQAAALGFVVCLGGTFAAQLLDAIGIVGLRTATSWVFIGSTVAWLLALTALERRSGA